METFCEYCGSGFEAQRSTAKYCCPAHRVAYHRLTDDVDKLTCDALSAISKLRELQGYEHLVLQIDKSIRDIRNGAYGVQNNVPYEKIIKLENERDGK